MELNGHRLAVEGEGMPWETGRKLQGPKWHQREGVRKAIGKLSTK